MWDWQTIVVGLIVGAALVYAGRRALRSLRALRLAGGGQSSSSSCASGCGGCDGGAKNVAMPRPEAKLVQIGQPTRPAPRR